jgi:hypothetical protein
MSYLVSFSRQSFFARKRLSAWVFNRQRGLERGVKQAVAAAMKAVERTKMAASSAIAVGIVAAWRGGDIRHASP